MFDLVKVCIYRYIRLMLLAYQVAVPYSCKDTISIYPLGNEKAFFGQHRSCAKRTLEI